MINNKTSGNECIVRCNKNHMENKRLANENKLQDNR